MVVEVDDGAGVAEETVAPAIKSRGKLKPRPANWPRVEVIYELSGHELT